MKRVVSEVSYHEDPSAKRRRKMQETMNSLRAGITDAAKHGRWQSSSSWITDTVIFLSSELLQFVRTLLQEDLPGWVPKHPLPESGVGPSLRRLVDRIQAFFTKLLQSHAVFRHVPHFKSVFDTLQDLGATPTGEVALLKMLMTAIGPVDDVPPPSWLEIHILFLPAFAIRAVSRQTVFPWPSHELTVSIQHLGLPSI